MGGQKGGMTDENSTFPEVCKKAFQAQLTDIQDPIPKSLFTEKSIADFREMPARLLERSGRLNTPIYKAAGASHYSPLSWEEAIDKVVHRFKKVPASRSFFYSSGRSSNEAAFLLQLFARIYGTNNVNNCSYYCHQASGVGIGSTIGTGTATIQLADLRKADLIFVIGANPASNHPRYMHQLLDCRRRGGKVVVINPAREQGLVNFSVPSDIRSLLAGGSVIASDYIQPQIGGDIALLKGIAKAVIEMGKQDTGFMEKHTNGHQTYIADIDDTSWEHIVSASGVSQARIREIAEIYGNAKHVVFSWAMGITHHEHGVENVESIVNLALLRGMIGRPFAGLLPLRGHSNVQGIGSMGVTPVLKQKIFDAIERRLGVTLPAEPGMDTMACMKASYEGKIDLAFMLGGNLYNSNPDAQFAEEAMNRIPFKVFLNTTLNHGHCIGVDKEVLILPVAARDEESQQTTQESMFNFVRLSDGGIHRLDNIRSEVDIISEIAHKLLGTEAVDFSSLRSHKSLRAFIAASVPGYEQLDKFDDQGEEFQLSNRTFHEPYFATADKKANFKLCAIPELKGDEGAFRMMSVRSEGQFNSIIYEETDIYRGQHSRWIVLMNPEDMKSKGLKENDCVTLTSSVGKMEDVVVRKYAIQKGSIMTYYPESNVLIPTRVDPRSKTPAYKLTWVKIEKAH